MRAVQDDRICRAQPTCRCREAPAGFTSPRAAARRADNRLIFTTEDAGEGHGGRRTGGRRVRHRDAPAHAGDGEDVMRSCGTHARCADARLRGPPWPSPASSVVESAGSPAARTPRPAPAPPVACRSASHGTTGGHVGARDDIHPVSVPAARLGAPRVRRAPSPCPCLSWHRPRAAKCDCPGGRAGRRATHASAPAMAGHSGRKRARLSQSLLRGGALGSAAATGRMRQPAVRGSGRKQGRF